MAEIVVNGMELGVGCNNGTTGHVVKLDLRSDYDYLEAPEVSSCLLELKYLNYLDSSGNHFQFSSIPKFLGSMTHAAEIS